MIDSFEGLSTPGHIGGSTSAMNEQLGLYSGYAWRGIFKVSNGNTIALSSSQSFMLLLPLLSEESQPLTIGTVHKRYRSQRLSSTQQRGENVVIRQKLDLSALLIVFCILA